jgi:ABC-2 type transport system ATP-binding protein
VAGGSYGGALSLLLAAADSRAEAIVPQITWNDLRQALFPQSAVGDGTPTSPAAFTPTGGAGVFKKMWAGVFFSPAARSLARLVCDLRAVRP